MCRYQELNTLHSMREWHAQRKAGAFEGLAGRMASDVAASVPLPSDAEAGGSDFVASATAASYVVPEAGGHQQAPLLDADAFQSGALDRPPAPR